MPGSIDRKKKQSLGRSPGTASEGTSVSGATACVDAINNAERWTDAVKVACDILKLPDLHTRSGLKKVHRDFASTYDKLDRLLKGNLNNDRVAGTVVAIYTKLCLDSILRNKLVHDKGILNVLLPLLNRDMCRILVLQALRAITHHGGRETRLEIAKDTPLFLKMMEDFRTDEVIVDMLVGIIGHSAAEVVITEEPPSKELLKAIDLPRFLPLLLSSLKRPKVPSTLVDHALQFMVTAALHHSKDFFAFPSAVNLLIACTRSKDIHTRSISMSALLRLHHSIGEKEDYTMDPRGFIENVQRVPKHLYEVIMSTCGPDESEIYRTVNATHDFMEAILTYTRDLNMHKLALDIGKIILSNEYSVPPGCYHTKNENTGEDEVMDVGLPFIYWVDALPLCAKELRSSGSPDMLDLADIIDLKYLWYQDKYDEVRSLADRAIRRNPRVGFFYFYHILTSKDDLADCLRAAKKGLKCPNLTRYVKYALLSRSIEFAMFLGLGCFEDSSGDEKQWYEGVAFLTCALEDANEYLRSATVDDRFMKTIACVQPLLALIIKGNEFGPNLTELKDSAMKLKLAEQFAPLLGMTVQKTGERLCRDVIISQMPTASEEWSEFISQFQYEEIRKVFNIRAPGCVEEDIALWLESLNLDEEEGVASKCSVMVTHAHRTHRRDVNSKNVALYRCSWCTNPSAVLRKCGNCETARYCDAQCQKEHWKIHKKSCKQNPRSF